MQKIYYAFQNQTSMTSSLHKSVINALLTFPCNWLYRLWIKGAGPAHARLSPGVEDFACYVWTCGLLFVFFPKLNMRQFLDTRTCRQNQKITVFLQSKLIPNRLVNNILRNLTVNGQFAPVKPKYCTHSARFSSSTWGKFLAFFVLEHAFKNQHVMWDLHNTFPITPLLKLC